MQYLSKPYNLATNF